MKHLEKQSSLVHIVDCQMQMQCAASLAAFMCDKGTVLLTTFESKHLEKQPSAVHNWIHLTPVAVKTRFINRLDVLQRKHQGGYCL